MRGLARLVPGDRALEPFVQLYLRLEPQRLTRLADAPETLIEVVEPPAGPAPELRHLDFGRLHAIGWRPEVDLEDGMRRTLESPR